MSYKEKSIAYLSCFAISIITYFNMENISEVDDMSNTIEMNQDIDTENNNDQYALILDTK